MVAPAVIDLVRARFANVKQYSQALAAVPHDGLRGRFREILAESLLLPYLPPSVELLTGTILGANGQTREARNEDDLVLYDQTWAPLLLRTGGREAIIPITGVRAHIEVKSTLRLADVDDALRAAAELNRMSIHSAPIGLVFAFASDIGMNHHIPRLLLEQTAKMGYQPSRGQTPCPIQGVCVLGRGSWFLTENLKANLASGWYEVKAEEDRELLAFISIVSNAMFGKERGLGTHVLDCSWLIGPNPASPLVVPS
jgi:hypothetical protein